MFIQQILAMFKILKINEYFVFMISTEVGLKTETKKKEMNIITRYF